MTLPPFLAAALAEYAAAVAATDAAFDALNPRTTPARQRGTYDAFRCAEVREQECVRRLHAAVRMHNRGEAPK